MNQVNVRKKQQTDQSLPLLRETSDLLDNVRTRAFALFEKRGGPHGDDMADWLEAEKEVFRVPDMELAENEEEFQLQLALPGFDPKDIQIAVLPDTLIVEGEATHQHRDTTGTIHLCEFGERRVFRQIPLPKPVDVNHVSATLEKGLLKVRAAKAQPEKGKTAAA